MQNFSIIRKNKRAILRFIKGQIFCTFKKVEVKNIPIVINNFNRLDMLKKLICSLEIRGYKNIYIIDNKSTYLPLLNYYKECNYNVIMLDRNYGYDAFWKTDTYKLFWKNYYVLTDPDVQIIDDCPDNFMDVFYKLLKKYPLSGKVGFSLKIDDLPDFFSKKREVICWEKQFWEEFIEEGVYNAPIDTTFALYRPFSIGGANAKDNQMRVDYPYQLKHLPWYLDSNNLTDEELYYISETSKPTHRSK